MSKPRAVIDTSSLIRSYLGRKSEAHVAVKALLQTSELLASSETLEEFRDVLLRDKFNRISLDLRLLYIAEYEQDVMIIEPQIRVTVCVDPKDDKFLSLAVSAEASLILTDDDHLLRLHPFRSIDILSPAQYLERKSARPAR